MKFLPITFIAMLFNVSTILCLKKGKYASDTGASITPWLMGIAITIVTTQFLMLWTNIKGASLGLMVSTIIAVVIIASAFVEVQGGTGRLVWISVKQMPKLETIGYITAVFGVILVGLSQQLSSAAPPTNPAVTQSVIESS